MTLERRSDDRFICVQLSKAALILARGNSPDIQSVGVGSSGYSFALQVDESSTQQPIRTLRYSRNRDERELECSNVVSDYPVRLIDDTVVSGVTLQAAKSAVTARLAGIGVAMMFDSKRARSRIGGTQVDTAMLYSSSGGGRVPVNSIDSLRSYPERARDLSERYFEGANESFAQILDVIGDRP